MKFRREGSAGLGATIREKRQEAGKTLTEVGQLTGISQSYLSQIERGEVTNPTIEVLYRILAALGQNLVLETTPPERLPRGAGNTVYHSPFTLEELASLGEEYAGQDVVRLVQDVLKDPEIPIQQRRLLGKQIEGLVEVTRDEVGRVSTRDDSCRRS